MKLVNAPVGACVFDSVGFSQVGTAAQAVQAAVRCQGFGGYLGSVTPARLASVLATGLGFFAYTYGGEWRNGPARTVAWMNALQLPPGALVACDVENITDTSDAGALASLQQIRAWANGVTAAGFLAALYTAPPQPFTGDELGALPVTRYIASAGLLQDRRGKEWTEPTHCGYVLRQVAPSVDAFGWGYPVDFSQVGQDRKGRGLPWVVA